MDSLFYRQRTSEKFLQLFLLVLLISLLLGHPFALVKSILNGDVKVYDYGIYQQGIFNLAGGMGINPYLTVRDIFLFNDHFAPILFLPIPLVWLTGYHVTTLILFEWVTFIFFIWLTLKLAKPESTTEGLCIVFMILFSKGLLTALTYPMHPGLWSTGVWLT